MGKKKGKNEKDEQKERNRYRTRTLYHFNQQQFNQNIWYVYQLWVNAIRLVNVITVRWWMIKHFQFFLYFLLFSCQWVICDMYAFWTMLIGMKLFSKCVHRSEREEEGIRCRFGLFVYWSLFGQLFPSWFEWSVNEMLCQIRHFTVFWPIFIGYSQCTHQNIKISGHLACSIIHIRYIIDLVWVPLAHVNVYACLFY